MSATRVDDGVPRNPESGAGWAMFAGVMFLVAAAANTLYGITALVNDDDDLIGYVGRLESISDDESIDSDDDEDDTVGGELGPGPISPQELDGDELVAELEKFLRDQPDA